MSSVRSFMSPFQGFRLYVFRFPRLAPGATTINRSAIRGRSSLYIDSAGVSKSQISNQSINPSTVQRAGVLSSPRSSRVKAPSLVNITRSPLREPK